MTTVPDMSHVLKKAGFLYDQAGTGGRDVVFADEALAAIQNEQARTHWATQDRNEMLRQRDAARNDADALREKLASTPTLSTKLQEARLLAESRLAEVRAAHRDNAAIGARLAEARDLAETRLVEIRDLQQQLQLAKGLAHDRLEQVQALQVSAGESSTEILGLRDELKAALSNNAALSAMLVGRDASEQLRKAEDCGAALDGAVTGMQEATHGISRVLATHGRTMGSDLAGELVLILSRLTAVIQQAPK